jgi:uncharacterized protein
MALGYRLLLLCCALLAAGCGADLDATLVAAAKAGRSDAVAESLQRGADVDAVDAKFHATAVMWAAHEGHADILRLLLDHGADLQARKPSGETALWYAAQQGQLGTTQILLQAGADPLPVARSGVSAAAVARMGGHSEIADLLDRVPRAER